MYHFCLQEVNQPAQFLKKQEGCLKRVNCSRILWCIRTSRKRWASGLFHGARSKYQYLSWHPGVFSGSQDEGRVHGRVVTEESYVSEKVAHTWHPYRPAVKANTWKSHNMAWQVLEVCHRTWRWESQKYPCWRRPWLLFCQCWAWAPWNVCSCEICLAGTVGIQLCLKWEQCHQHNHKEGPELNPRQWQHLSARSRICQCLWK